MPRNRCAIARDVGSRYNNQATGYLYEEWLPLSGESPGDFPIFFHYVNVGPDIHESEMITEVYLPLKFILAIASDRSRFDAVEAPVVAMHERMSLTEESENGTAYPRTV
jgi:hypothetical protein